MINNNHKHQTMTTKTYRTANTTTGEYFTIDRVESMNTTISLFDCSGFLGTKKIANDRVTNWTIDTIK